MFSIYTSSNNAMGEIEKGHFWNEGAYQNKGAYQQKKLREGLPREKAFNGARVPN